MSSNYPPGITGMEPEISGAYENDAALDKTYMSNHLAHTLKVIREVKAKIADCELVGQPTEQLERVLENNYAIKDDLEMSLLALAWEMENIA